MNSQIYWHGILLREYTDKSTYQQNLKWFRSFLIKIKGKTNG